MVLLLLCLKLLQLICFVIVVKELLVDDVAYHSQNDLPLLVHFVLQHVCHEPVGGVAEFGLIVFVLEVVFQLIAIQLRFVLDGLYHLIDDGCLSLHGFWLLAPALVWLLQRILRRMRLFFIQFLNRLLLLLFLLLLLSLFVALFARGRIQPILFAGHHLHLDRGLFVNIGSRLESYLLLALWLGVFGWLGGQRRDVLAVLLGRCLLFLLESLLAKAWQHFGSELLQLGL